jgi:hypothetical protein
MSADPTALKAQAEAEKALADATKAKADARAAEAAARKAEREADEAAAPTARGQREAESRKATAEADKAAAAARREQLAALIPDFSKVQPGSLEVKGDQPMFGTALAQRALEAAAKSAMEQAAATLSNDDSTRLLMITDADLATSDGVYHNVSTGLDQLIAAAEKLLEEPKLERVAGVVALAGALAGAVPGLLSLFSSRRTVTTAPVAITDLAAVAAATGALKKAKPGLVVTHDTLRLLPTGAIHERIARLSGLRQKLTGKKLETEDERARITGDLTTARETVAGVLADLEWASEESRPALKEQLELAQKQASGYEEVLTGMAVRVGLIDSVREAIDAFMVSLTGVPDGQTRSPLTLAVMREQLHASPGQEPAFTHVLLVKGEGGSAAQTVDDRPLWSEDKFSVVATAGITYMLIETTRSTIVEAGVATASAAGHGTIGSQFALDKVTVG